MNGSGHRAAFRLGAALAALLTLTALGPGVPVSAGDRSAAAEPELTVLADGLPLDLDVPPLLAGGRILVPFRAVAEALQVAVAWDPATRTVHATDDGTTVQVTVGSPTAYRNGQPVTLDVPAVLRDGRTLVPLRFFGEAFGCRVEWDGAARTVRIQSPPRPMPVIGFYALGDRQTSSWTNLFGRPFPEHTPGHTDLVGELALGWYSVERDGTLTTRSRTGWQRPDGWEAVLAVAAQYGLETEMVVHVTDHDGTITDLLASGEAMARAAAAVSAEAARYDGVNLNFEGLGLSGTAAEIQAVRERFTAFVRMVADGLRGQGKRLTLTLHAPNSAYRGYDYAALGEVADRIVVMAYDYGPKPEPVDRVLAAVEAARAAVPAGKLVLGISVPNETPASVLTKVAIARRHRLGGIALWRLGLVSPEMWAALRSAIAPRSR